MNAMNTSLRTTKRSRRPSKWKGSLKRVDLRATVVRIVVTGLAAAVIISVVCNIWVVNSTTDRVYTSTETVPANDVGLVLGAGARTGDGGMNPHFKARTEAAAMLYREGKIRHLLLSGDNHSKEYDEPNDMKNYLISLGVPSSAITLDYAGFRTLDSMARAKQVFGLDRFTIITDQFHSYRAVFLARHFGIDAIAFCSAPVPWYYSIGVRLREVAARVKAPIDLFILHRGPRFLGPPLKHT